MIPYQNSLQLAQHEHRIRKCYANPHGALQPACYHHQFFLGELVEELCTCDGNLCNGAERSTLSAFSSNPFLFMTTFVSLVSKYTRLQ